MHVDAPQLFRHGTRPAECGPATAAPGDFSWAITGCRWAELGSLETTEECEAACVAAQARLCVFGEYALGNCFAYFEDCPGDCSLRLSEDTVFQRWATCYQVPQGALRAVRAGVL